MSLSSRLAKAEGGLSNALLWFDAQKLASETGQPPEEIFHDARSLVDKYSHLARPLPGGKVDIEPVLRAMAEGEAFDYDELAADVRRHLRNQRARERRQGR